MRCGSREEILLMEKVSRRRKASLNKKGKKGKELKSWNNKKLRIQGKL